MDRVSHFLIFPGAVAPGDQHASANGQSGEKPHQQPGHVAADTNSGQGGCPAEVAHDHGVCAIVQTLENLAQQNGQGKLAEQQRGVALG